MINIAERENISVEQFRNVIKRLPSDPPQNRPGIWYTTQKQHWLGWLAEYHGPGAYGRNNLNRDAKFAYNHVVCPDLLLYPIRAIPLEPKIIAGAEIAASNDKTKMEKAGAIRKIVPWEFVYKKLWGK